MPARVFVALLVSDDGRRTAAELAEMLKVSPAAISNAVRYLQQVRLAVREREPGNGETTTGSTTTRGTGRSPSGTRC